MSLWNNTITLVAFNPIEGVLEHMRFIIIACLSRQFSYTAPVTPHRAQLNPHAPGPLQKKKIIISALCKNRNNYVKLIGIWRTEAIQTHNDIKHDFQKTHKLLSSGKK